MARCEPVDVLQIKLKRKNAVNSSQLNEELEVSENESELDYLLDLVIDDKKSDKRKNAVNSCQLDEEFEVSENESELDYLLDLVIDDKKSDKISESSESSDEEADVEDTSVELSKIRKEFISNISAKRISESSESSEEEADVEDTSVELSKIRKEFVSNISAKRVLTDLSKIIKTESVSPEPTTSSEMTQDRGHVLPSNNLESTNNFSITVSFMDNRKSQNCAVYSEPKNKLYISKDYEFQIMCSATSVPSGSVIRATCSFASTIHSHKVVKRCPTHRQEDLILGKPAFEHVIQSMNDGAVYEKNERTGRYSVVVPYQNTPGSEALSCYAYKFTCWTSCALINRKPFNVHFTLENNGIILGKQTLDVRVCACPARDFRTEAEKCDSLSSSSPIPKTIAEDSNSENSEQPAENYTITMGDFMTTKIKEVLPNLPSNKVNEVYENLIELGVENQDDLAFVEEADLNKLLKPIQSRKLLAAWKNKTSMNQTKVLPKRDISSLKEITIFPERNISVLNPSFPERNVPALNPTFPERNVPALNPCIISLTRSDTALSQNSLLPPQNETGAINQNAILLTRNEVTVNQNTVLPMEEGINLQSNLIGPSTSRANTIPVSTSPSDWAESFTIPWHKMPDKLMACLKNKGRPSPSLRRDMIRIICYEVQKIMKKPRKTHLQIIAKKAVKQFPESLCDSFCGEVVGCGYISLTQQFLNRIETMNRNVCSQNTSSPDANILPDSNESVNGQGILSSESDETSTVSSCVSSSSNNVFSQSSDWAESFVIPWHKMPSRLMERLNNHQRPTPSLRRTMVRIICDEVQKIKIKPRKRELSIIAKQAFEKFPQSLCDNLCEDIIGNGYISLTKQLQTRFENINRRSSFQDAASSDMYHLTVSSECIDKSTALLTDGRGMCSQSNSSDLSALELFNECMSGQGSLLPENEEISFQLNYISPSDSSTQPGNAHSTSSSEWAEAFMIPWQKMPGELMDCLRNKKRPDPSLRRTMIRIICYEVQKIKNKPGKRDMQIIAKKTFQQFPESLCDNLCGEIIGNGYISLSRQLITRIENLNRKSSSPGTAWSEAASRELTLADTYGYVNWKDSTLPESACNNSQLNCIIPSTSSINRSNISSMSTSDWADAFKIPWHKMPTTLMDCLTSKKRPSQSLRRVMVRIICDEAQQIKRRPRKKHLRVIAKKAFQEFPESLCDSTSGDVVGIGYGSLVRQLTLRIENANRGSYCKNTTLKRKCTISDSYGCINWQPNQLPDGETKETQQLKKKELQLTSKQKKVLDNHILKLLDVTFYSQRLDINNSTSTVSLITEWPLLFTESGLLGHFRTLVGLNLLEKLNNSLVTKGSTILSFLSTLPVASKSRHLKKVLQEVYAESYDVKSNCRTCCASIVFVIMAYFLEHPESLFLTVDSRTETSVIEGMPGLPITPCLVVCGKSVFSCSLFMLSIDGKIINSDIKSFETGLALMFASYYVFNICYPSTAAATLEFLQRCFFGINPDEGTKSSTKKRAIYNAKVVTLLRNIADFQWSL